MNKELFRQMQSQLEPGAEAVDNLKARLETTPRKKTHWGRYVALAACLTLAIAAIPLGQTALLADRAQPQRHSYVTMDAPFQPIAELKNPIDGGGESAPTGSPGQGGDVSVQPGAEAYDRLMQGMGMLEEDSQYPDWYGGAYIGADGQLTVLLVDEQNPGDKSLELQVLGWTGDGTSFSSAKYSHAYLTQLMDRLDAELPALVGEGGWSVNTAENRVDVDLVLPVRDEVLELLAQLDPSDDAIQINAYTQPKMELKAGEDKAKLGEEPAPGGDMDGDPAGYDTLVEKLPGHIVELPDEKTQAAAHYDLAEEPKSVTVQPVEGPMGARPVEDELPVPEPEEQGEPDPEFPVEEPDGGSAPVPGQVIDTAHHDLAELPEQLPGGAYVSEAPHRD